MTRKIESELMQRATLFTISLRRWGNQRKADLSKVQTKANKRRLHLTKKLVKSDAYDELRSYQTEAKDWCLQRCMPSYLRNGVFIVLLTEVKAFEDELARRVKELQRIYVPKFLSDYERCIGEAKTQLGDQFNSGDYPPSEDLARRFAIEWGWISFGVPDNIPAGLREREIKKLQQAYAEAQEEILAALRRGFGELVAHAVDKLTLKVGEKPKTFRDSLVENFKQFFSTFEARNLMQDEELGAVVKRAKEILSGVDADKLRSKPDVRRTVVDAMEGVKAQVNKLIQDRPGRKFKLEEE